MPDAKTPQTELQIRREFQSWLRNAASERGLTQDEIARLVQAQVEIHPRTITAWFGGQSTPRYPQLVALVRALQALPPTLSEFCRDASDET